MEDVIERDPMHDFYSADTARKILTSFKRWAVVGASADPSRASFGVMRYLARNGYDVVPVNPNVTACQNLECYPDLRSVPGEIEVVDLFRRSEFVGASPVFVAGGKARVVVRRETLDDLISRDVPG